VHRTDRSKGCSAGGATEVALTIDMATLSSGSLLQRGLATVEAVDGVH
jgi:hypothetical protein